MSVRYPQLNKKHLNLVINVCFFESREFNTDKTASLLSSIHVFIHKKIVINELYAYIH
jgi:hypothetical protein